MKIYVVVLCEYSEYGIIDTKVMDSYYEESDAKAFCSFENAKIDFSTKEYKYYESEIY